MTEFVYSNSKGQNIAIVCYLLIHNYLSLELPS